MLDEQLEQTNRELEAAESQLPGLKDQLQALEDQTDFLGSFIKSQRYDVQYKKSNEALQKVEDAQKQLDESKANQVRVGAELQQLNGAIQGMREKREGIQAAIKNRDCLRLRRRVLQGKLKRAQQLKQLEKLDIEIGPIEREFEELNITLAATRIGPDRTLVYPVMQTMEYLIPWAQEELKRTEAQLAEMEA